MARIKITELPGTGAGLAPGPWWPQAALYRVYDKAGRLLYIGVSRNPRDRWYQHSRKAPWWSQASWIDYCVYRNENVALDAERHAICDEQPLHNKRSSGRDGECSVWCAICARKAVCI